jgi:hypothetical protein
MASEQHKRRYFLNIVDQKVPLWPNRNSILARHFPKRAMIGDARSRTFAPEHIRTEV